MGAPIVDDELWALIEPLLPTPKPRHKKYSGRLSVANRAALNGILFVLKTVSARATLRCKYRVQSSIKVNSSLR
jgi:transposase